MGDSGHNSKVSKEDDLLSDGWSSPDEVLRNCSGLSDDMDRGPSKLLPRRRNAGSVSSKCTSVADSLAYSVATRSTVSHIPAVSRSSVGIQACLVADSLRLDTMVSTGTQTTSPERPPAA